MDRIVDHVLAFEGNGKIKDFTGNFSEYRDWEKNQESKAKTQDSRAKNQEMLVESQVNIPTNISQQPKKKLSYKEQRELETLEKEMPELEKKRDKILELLNNETDYEKIAQLSADLESISENLENMEMRWLELQEIIG